MHILICEDRPLFSSSVFSFVFFSQVKNRASYRNVGVGVSLLDGPRDSLL